MTLPASPTVLPLARDARTEVMVVDEPTTIRITLWNNDRPVLVSAELSPGRAMTIARQLLAAAQNHYGRQRSS